MEHVNSELQNDIEALISWLSETLSIPEYQGIKVAIDLGEGVEDSGDSRVQIKKENILSIGDYADEYSRLKKSGFSWINLHCAGILGDDLIVVIEYPNAKSNVSQVSVNMSGPTNDITTNTPNWDFDASYKLV